MVKTANPEKEKKKPEISTSYKLALIRLTADKPLSRFLTQMQNK